MCDLIKVRLHRSAWHGYQLCVRNSIKIPNFSEISKNKWYHAKVLLKRFHLNGHTMGFHPQTQKLELHYMSLT